MLKLTTEPNQVWFLADSHINHANLCRGTSKWTDTNGCRDFNTLQEMEDTIVGNYNRLVKPDDIVFHLGDVIFGDKAYLPKFLAKLNCRNITLIRGNHDDYLDKLPEFKKEFTAVHDFGLEVGINGKLFVLCHYPLLVWRDSNKGSICLVGHSHGSLPDDPQSRRLDIGLDTTWYNHPKFCPWSLDEILNVCYNLKGGFKSVDHHR